MTFVCTALLLLFTHVSHFGRYKRVRMFQVLMIETYLIFVEISGLIKWRSHEVNTELGGSLHHYPGGITGNILD